MKTKIPMSAILATLAGALLSLGALATELAIPGSGNPEHVLGALASAFNAGQKLHVVTVPPSTGTAGGIRDVLAGKAELARVGRPLHAEESAKGLAFLPIGRDAVVFVAGAGVDVRNVTSAQMVDAFTGRITDWRELRGRPGPIRVIGRESGDASRQAMAARIPAFRDIAFGPGVKVVHLDPQLIDLLDRFGTSLGLLNRSALEAARTKVSPLSLDGVEPTPVNVATGRYPVWLEFGLIHRAGQALSPGSRAFVDFLASPEGKRILRDHGIIPPLPGP